MTAPTAQEQRERIEAIITTHLSATITTVHDGPECPIAAADLPLAVVLARGATRIQTSREGHFATRAFDVIVLVTELCDDSVEEQRRVFDATEALIDILPDYFARYAPRLELNKTSLNGVWELGGITDDGPEFRQWGGLTYGAITHRIPITSKR